MGNGWIVCVCRYPPFARRVQLIGFLQSAIFGARAQIFVECLRRDTFLNTGRYYFLHDSYHPPKSARTQRAFELYVSIILSFTWKNATSVCRLFGSNTTDIKVQEQSQFRCMPIGTLGVFVNMCAEVHAPTRLCGRPPTNHKSHTAIYAYLVERKKKSVSGHECFKKFYP